jgi:enoyl-CoA hydratase
MTEPAVLVERDGHVLTVSVNRPDVRNAVNAEVLCRWADAWDLADGDDDIRVVILTGVGEHFCAGADLDKLVGRLTRGEPAETEFEQRIMDDYTLIYKGFLKTYTLATPLIAAVEGYCLAGGTEILQATDIRVAGEGAVFGVTEARWSLFPMSGSTVRLKRQIPYTKAMEMLLTADQFSAEEVLDMGLIGHVMPKGQALAKAREIAAKIARNGPLAVKAIKRAVIDTEFLSEAEAFELENKIGIEVMMSEDAREGPRAFKEKREPNFKGR